MAAGRMVIAGWMPALDVNGLPIPNAQMYFYLNETTTLATVYADEALTVPLANPVLANSSGQFPPIWADDANRFSVTIDAPYGPPGQPFSFDNISPSTSASIPENGADRRMGLWNAETNDPILTAGVGVEGQYYVVSVEGYRNVEPNPVPGDTVFWAIDDRIQFSNGAWVRVPAGVSDVITYEDGAVEKRRAVTDKLRDLVNAQDAPDFAAARLEDAKASLEALFAVRVGLGGVVELPPGDIYVSSLTVPAGVRLVASGTKPAQNDWDRNPAKYGSTIWLAPGGTITLLNMAGIEGVRVLNPELNYPTILPNGTASATYEQVMGLANYTTGPFAGRKAGVAQFSGTAITIGGDDTYVKDCLVIGFQWAYKSANYAPGTTQGPLPGPSRQNIDGLYSDCTNGIDITNCWDIPRVRNCNAWNFFCGHIPGLQQWGLVARHGTAYKFHDKVDGLMMTNCFGLGWDFTYWFENIYAAQVTACTGDGAVDPSVAVPNGAGLITRGSIYGLHLNGVRCDGNKTNFKFWHDVGSVDGRIISGQTSNGLMVEVGAPISVENPSGIVCNGFTLDVTVAGSTTEAIRIRPGCKNTYFRSIDAVFLHPAAGDIIRFDAAADLKQTYIGAVNKDVNTNTHGERVLAPLTVGGSNPVTVKLEGAGSGSPFAKVSAKNEAGSPATLDLQAYGFDVNTNVRIGRVSYSGALQVLARFASTEPTNPANFLFLNEDASNSRMTVEGAASSVNIRVSAKGTGTFQSIPTFMAGVGNNDFLSLSGGTGGVTLAAEGSSSQCGLDIQAKNTTGNVRILTLISGVGHSIARFVKATTATAANLVFQVDTANSVVIAAENGPGGVATLTLTGQGIGGVIASMGTYADNAAATAAGIPVGAFYKTATGEVRVRV